MPNPEELPRTPEGGQQVEQGSEWRILENPAESPHPTEQNLENPVASPRPTEQGLDDPAELSRPALQASNNPVDAEGLKARYAGARALGSQNFESRHPITDSSFHKFRQSGEKFSTPAGEKPLKNPEKRDYAYLARLDNIIDKYGTAAEKKLWDMSAKRLIVKEEDIPESYWQTQEQILRDNGQGRKLSDYEKDILTKDAQEKQRASLETWTNYLSDENSPYPVWFKIFAWEGMSKLSSVFDKNKKQYTKRDKTTMASFPRVNPAALAKTYGVVSNFYGIHNEDCYNENAAPENLDQLAKSGNFNKIYSKMLLESKIILKTPERTEDVHGEWVEYLPGDEKKLSLAAEGTPWCIADSNVGRNYLEKGAYGNGYDDDYDDYDNSSQAKFILFRLKDSNTGQLADNACASIRLGTDGNVAEISGLNDGQALEDSLVPIVEEKVKTLPGGDKFLQAFADKNALIHLDRKWQAGENFTPEEWDFVFEKNRKIATLDTYNDIDPRLAEFRGIEALNHGAELDDLTSRLGSRSIITNLDMLIGHGAKMGDLAARMDSRTISDNLDMLIDRAGADVDGLVSQLDSSLISSKLDRLIDQGANVENLVSRMKAYAIISNLDKLIEHGANININNLVSKAEPYTVVSNLSTLINHGADIDDLVARMDPTDIVKNLDTIMGYGAHIADIHLLAEQMKKETEASIGAYQSGIIDWPVYYTTDDLRRLLRNGADINRLAEIFGENIRKKLESSEEA